MVVRNATLLIAGLIAGFANASVAQPLGDTGDPVKIAINDWTGQHITAHIYGSVLEKMGYKVEYITAGTIPQFTGLASGSLDVQPETWTGGIGESYIKAVANKEIEEVGQLGLDAKDGWIYTDATKEVCPGLPSWTALKDSKCADALSTPDTFPSGRLLDYPADWGTTSPKVLANAGLAFQAIPAGSEGALVAELQSAVAGNKPLLMRFWSPHWVLATVKVNWLEMPPCNATGDNRGLECIIAPPVGKVVWPGFSKKWPAGYSVTKKFTLSADDQQAMIYAIDQDKKPLESVVAEWMTKNEPTWSAWTQEATK